MIATRELASIYKEISLVQQSLWARLLIAGKRRHVANADTHRKEIGPTDVAIGEASMARRKG